MVGAATAAAVAAVLAATRVVVVMSVVVLVVLVILVMVVMLALVVVMAVVVLVLVAVVEEAYDGARNSTGTPTRTSCVLPSAVALNTCHHHPSRGGTHRRRRIEMSGATLRATRRRHALEARLGSERNTDIAEYSVMDAARTSCSRNGRDSSRCSFYGY